MNQNRKVIGVCALLAVSVGAANSIFKNKRLPSTRFMIGSGVAFLVLSAIGEMGESGSELAKGLAMGIASTVILGDGGGLLSYIDGRGETDTQKKSHPAPSFVATAPSLTPDPPDVAPSVPGLSPNAAPPPSHQNGVLHVQGNSIGAIASALANVK